MIHSTCHPLHLAFGALLGVDRLPAEDFACIPGTKNLRAGKCPWPTGSGFGARGLEPSRRDPPRRSAGGSARGKSEALDPAIPAIYSVPGGLLRAVGLPDMFSICFNRLEFRSRISDASMSKSNCIQRRYKLAAAVRVQYGHPVDGHVVKPGVDRAKVRLGTRSNRIHPCQ